MLGDFLYSGLSGAFMERVERRFKVGDKVVCVDFEYNPVIKSVIGNKIHTVSGYTDCGAQLKFLETSFTFNDTRFRLATLLERELSDV